MKKSLLSGFIALTFGVLLFGSSRERDKKPVVSLDSTRVLAVQNKIQNTFKEIKLGTYAFPLQDGLTVHVSEVGSLSFFDRRGDDVSEWYSVSNFGTPELGLANDYVLHLEWSEKPIVYEDAQEKFNSLIELVESVSVS